MNSVIHNSGTFIGKEGNETYFQNWTVTDPEFNLLISHGIDQTSDDYEILLNKLKDKNISIYAYDHRGFGKSGGKAGHAERFMNFVYDLNIYYEMIQQFDKETPTIIYGHSLGALIALNHMISYPGKFRGAVLSSPLFYDDMQNSQIKNRINKLAGKYFPTKHIQSKPSFSDPILFEKFKNNELIGRSLTAGLHLGIQESTDFSLQNIENIDIPVLIIKNENDQIHLDGLNKNFYSMPAHQSKTNSKKNDLHNILFNWTFEIISNKMKKKKIS